MRTGALAFLGIAIASLGAAAPPDRGGVMIGPDSSLIIYWIHPEINCYEQGYDDDSESRCIVGGEGSGSYAVAVNFRVPFAAFLESIRTKMSLTDQYVGEPGDQYSPFRVAVYESDSDGGPLEPPLYGGPGQLCGGEPCLNEWYEQPLHLSRMTPGGLWQVFQWAVLTPLAPQIMGRIRRQDDPPALLGFDDGSGPTWDSLYYLPVFRQRLLGVVPLDTVVDVGWRRRMTADNPPDSFLISGFLGDTVAADFFHADTDTLICRLTAADFDSVSIRSCYAGIVDDSAWVVPLEKSKSPPILADIVFPDSKMNQSAMLHIINLVSEPILLGLTYDHGSTIFETDTVLLGGHETKMISGAVLMPPDDTTDVMIILADEENRYYPFMVWSLYPQTGQTSADGDGGEGVSKNDDPVKIYPNPCFKSVNIADDNFRAVREIAVYNVIGQRIADVSPPFRARMTWNGCDREGRAAPPGIYFVRISYDEGAVTRSVLLMR